MNEPRESSQEIPPTLEPGPAQAPGPEPAVRLGPGRRAGEGSWWFRVAVEVLLISVGVFLALMGDQWRESAHDEPQTRIERDGPEHAELSPTNGAGRGAGPAARSSANGYSSL